MAESESGQQRAPAQRDRQQQQQQQLHQHPHHQPQQPRHTKNAGFKFRSDFLSRARGDKKPGDSESREGPAGEQKEGKPAGEQKEGKPAGRTRKQRRAEALSDPIKVVRAVLERSTYRDPDLSQLVEDRLKGSADFKISLKYEATVGATVDGMSDVCCSVFPRGFNGRVNLSPASIMSLPCIYAIPNVRKRRWHKNRGAPPPPPPVKEADRKKEPDGEAEPVLAKETRHTTGGPCPCPPPHRFDQHESTSLENPSRRPRAEEGPCSVQ